ncbi:hypothetical protein ACHQM5_016377 [Ranunculus cassubicifolius]
MASEEFCGDYLVLEPEKGGIYDFLHLLCSPHTETNQLTDCPKGTEISEFERRRIIFMSLAVQKILLYIVKPMAWFGAMYEMWLNLDLFVLFMNLFKGKWEMPDPSSATFSTAIGNMDYRVELDRNIKYGDSRYYGSLSIMASKLSYENPAFIENIVTNQWKMEFLGANSYWNDYQQNKSTSAFMFREKTADSEVIVVAFRGTPPFDAVAWSTDVDYSWYELPTVGKVHGGFMKALGLQKIKGWPNEIDQEESRQVAYYTIREKLREELMKNENAKFIVTGHSLGGALAVLFPLVLSFHEETWMLKRLEGVYTFGQPRVGDEKLGEYMEKKMSEHGVPYVRAVYGNDMVPRLPYDNSADLYRHFGNCLYYNSLYEGMILEEEPNKNYFSLWMVIPKILNALWELVRSFIIPVVKGSEYHESISLRLFRVIGLIIPGLSAHAPQDYVNSMRLDSSILPLSPKNPTNLSRKLE